MTFQNFSFIAQDIYFKPPPLQPSSLNTPNFHKDPFPLFLLWLWFRSTCVYSGIWIYSCIPSLTLLPFGSRWTFQQSGRYLHFSVWFM